MSLWNIFNTMSTALFGIMDEILDPTNLPIYDSDRYVPSIKEVLAVKRILTKKGELPLELVDTIIDFAEYWVRTTTCRTGGDLIVQSGRERENKLLLRSYPLGYIPTEDDPTTLDMTTTDKYPSKPSKPWSDPGNSSYDATQELLDRWTRDSFLRGEFPCRKIVFTIKSHDQGWGGPPNCRGTYKGSSTWFDVGLERVSAFRQSQIPPFRPTGTPATDRLPPPRCFTEIQMPEGTHIEPVSASTPGTSQDLIVSKLVEGALPYFSVSDPQSSSRDPAAYFCCTHTIIPTTDSRQTATEPPETKYWFRHAQDPGLDCLQRNRTATRDTEEYKITWSCLDNTDPDSVDGKKLDEVGRGRATGNGEYVRNLKIGDVVTVWGKARYQGWANHVEEVKIDVYWAV